MRRPSLCGLELDALAEAPTAVGFLAVARYSNIEVALLAEPHVALHVAAYAMGETFYFRGHHEWLLLALREVAQELLPLAASLVLEPLVESWCAPLDRSNQYWIGNGSPSKEEPWFRSRTVDKSWEDYAQKPNGGIATSTKFGETSSALAALRHHTGDYYEGDVPFSRRRVVPDPGARVFEVQGPLDWHHLCASYPSLDKDGRMVPLWNAVSADWDAVHLSLGGLVAADQVKTRSSLGWSELRFWEFEQTRWLNWSFSEIEMASDVVYLPDSPVPLAWPPALRPRGRERIHLRKL